MGSPEPLPDHVRITARAEHDLAKLLKKDPQRFARVWNDVKQLSKGTLPQRPKKLKGFTPPMWQLDSGEFRIFLTWEGPILWIRGVLRKTEQSQRFRALR
jgi:mRNA-degrading endonuclease RelE of RelBE toxin-antitoxin system